MMSRQRDARTWLRRPQPSGTEPRKARSAYRARIFLAGFGLLTAGGAALYFGTRSADGGGAATLGATVFFALIALLALINVVVVGLRWRGRHSGFS